MTAGGTRHPAVKVEELEAIPDGKLHPAILREQGRLVIAERTGAAERIVLDRVRVEFDLVEGIEDLTGQLDLLAFGDAEDLGHSGIDA